MLKKFQNAHTVRLVKLLEKVSVGVTSNLRLNRTFVWIKIIFLLVITILPDTIS